VFGVEAWYRAYADRLTRFVRRIAAGYGLSGTQLDAEDVVQEVFEHMQGRLGTIENPPGWLRAVARSKVGRARDQQRYMASGDAGDYLSEDHPSVRWTSLSRCADIDSVLAVRAVLRAMAELPDRQQVAAYLYHVEGWSQAEIGEHLRCAKGTVGAHVHRAVRTLRIGSHGTLLMGNTGRLTLTRIRGWWVWCRCWAGEPEEWSFVEFVDGDSANSSQRGSTSGKPNTTSE